MGISYDPTSDQIIIQMIPTNSPKEKRNRKIIGKETVHFTTEDILRLCN